MLEIYRGIPLGSSVSDWFVSTFYIRIYHVCHCSYCLKMFEYMQRFLCKESFLVSKGSSCYRCNSEEVTCRFGLRFEQWTVNLLSSNNSKNNFSQLYNHCVSIVAHSCSIFRSKPTYEHFTPTMQQSWST